MVVLWQTLERTQIGSVLKYSSVGYRWVFDSAQRGWCWHQFVCFIVVSYLQNNKKEY